MRNPCPTNSTSAEHARTMLDLNNTTLPLQIEKEVAAFAKLKAPWSNKQRECPCCGIKTNSSEGGDFFGSACDNSRWNWNGEPPFCCLCANLKGIGRLSHFGCDSCKARRSRFYKRTSWCSPRCKNCGMAKTDHIAASQRSFPRCPKVFDSDDSCDNGKFTLVVEVGGRGKLV
uniref:Uncharacterized protein n=1 Tax=Guillardia theta TaxID=55529 RepID=A0A7S4UKD6_GUITH|mmetsp:Transcript_44664/g.140923  ORF Transcript_44664/g.140923 Transcript_44664/m.140923 type:complete len:173 (+) Transcript_44664:303-821(+)